MAVHGSDVTKGAIIDINSIVSGRNYDILTSIIAKLLMSRPFGDLSHSFMLILYKVSVSISDSNVLGLGQLGIGLGMLGLGLNIGRAGLGLGLAGLDCITGLWYECLTGTLCSKSWWLDTSRSLSVITHSCPISLSR